MPQYSVRMKVERVEIWTVEAESEDDAMAKALACEGIIDEQDSDLVNWEPTWATLDE